MTTERIPQRAAQVRASVLGAMLLGSIALFVWLLQRVAAGGTHAFDAAMMAAVESVRTSALTAIAVGITALGAGPVLGVLTALAVVALIALGRRVAALETALATSCAGILTNTIKIALSRARPPLDSHLVTVSGYSFPSGHASGVAAFLTALALVAMEAARSRTQRRTIAIVYVLLLGSVGGSRVYLGVHYPSDVIAGSSLGIACALGAHALTRTRNVIRWFRG